MTPIASRRTQKMKGVKDVNNGEPDKLDDKNVDQNLADSSVKPKMIRACRTNKQTTETKTTTNLVTEPKKQTTKQKAKRKPKATAKRKITKTEKDPVIELKSNLEDELMRNDRETPESLNTSKAIKASNDEDNDTEKDPDVPEMECTSGGKSEEQTPNKKENHQSKRKRYNSLSLIRNVDRKTGSDKSNNLTVSPLPGNVVETVLETDRATLNDLLFTELMEQLAQEKEDATRVWYSTQNSLSDIEPTNDVPKLNVTDELKKNADASRASSEIVNQSNKEEKSVKESNPKSSIQNLQIRKKRERSTKSRASADQEVVQPTCSSVHVGTEKSIVTHGTTGHGDLNKTPPHSTLRKDDTEPRLVEEENYSNSLKDFFMEPCTELDETNDVRSEVKKRSTSGRESNRGNLRSKTDGSVSNKTDDRSSCSHNDNKTSTHNSSNLRLNRKTRTSSTRQSEDLNVKNIEQSSKPQSEKEGTSNEKQKAASKMPETTKTNKTNRKSNESKQSSEPMRHGDDSKSSRDTGASKRKSSPKRRSSKRSKLGLNDEDFIETADSESGPSIRSVDEWFRRKAPTHIYTNDNIRFTIKENTRSLLEKLRTTLVEIHHNTSDRFVKMFVTAQNDFLELKDKRNELYEDIISKIKSMFDKLLEELTKEFSNLEKRSQRLDEEFLKGMRGKSREVLREDGNQKRLMVTLLEEDLQAVLDHMNQ